MLINLVLIHLKFPSIIILLTYNYYRLKAILSESCVPNKEDLHYVASQLTVKINVDDLVYELIGEISSDKEASDAIFEQYLVSPQEMAWMKQTGRKSETPQNPFVSAGNLPLALGGTSHSGMATRSSPAKRPILPSFSSDEDPDSGGSSRSKWPRRDKPAVQNQGEPSRKDPSRKLLVPIKNIRSKPLPKPSMKKLAGSWNRTAWIGKQSETAKGWLRKTKKKRNEQNRLLRQAHPGTVALREIRHYQCCQSFLISMAPFQRLVWELCEDSPYRQKDVYLRWQVTALFTLQTTTELYMAGFFGDVNLCAVHCKVKMINWKDMVLAIEIRGREHIDGRASADMGGCNIGGYFASDASERRALPAAAHKTDYVQHCDWAAELREKVAIDPQAATSIGKCSHGKGGGKGIQKRRRQRLVVRDAIHGITKSAICQLVRRGGVEQIPGLIYEETRGVLKQFLEAIIKDAILFTQYNNWCTVTPIDIVFALKQHGWNMYGFTRPYLFSVKKKDIPPPLKPRDKKWTVSVWVRSSFNSNYCIR